MNGLTRTIALAVAASLSVAPMVQAAQPPAAIGQFEQLQAELRRTHASGDSTAYLAGSRALYSFLNGSPRATLQLMSAETAAGRPQEALRRFADYLAMGQADEAVLNAKTFDPLRTLPRYQSLHASMAENSRGVCAASAVFRMDAAQVAEDIDFDPLTKSFFVSTVLGQQILQIDMAGNTKMFAAAPDHWPMMALKVDSRRRIIWATEVAVDGFASVKKQDWGRSAVLQYDLRSGKLLHRTEGPPKAALGDMALDPGGNAIVADGDQGGLYRISRRTRRIERIDGGDFISPQTPAVLSDGHILVPDYVRGIGILDVTTRRVAWIGAQGKHALSGIDGLYSDGRILIATQNGVVPERVVRFTLDAAGTAIVSEHLIERATATLGDPTHGVIVGDTFYYIADSGWNVLDDHGTLMAGKVLPSALLMRTAVRTAISGD